MFHGQYKYRDYIKGIKFVIIIIINLVFLVIIFIFFFLFFFLLSSYSFSCTFSLNFLCLLFIYYWFSTCFFSFFASYFFFCFLTNHYSCSWESEMDRCSENKRALSQIIQCWKRSCLHLATTMELVPIWWNIVPELLSHIVLPTFLANYCKNNCVYI